MKVAFISAEVAPFSKAGGLADVAGSLPAAIVSNDLQCHVISPLYGDIDRDAHSIVPTQITGSIEHCSRACSFQIWESKTLSNENLKYWFVHHPPFFKREGIYTDETGEGFEDNNERFFFFQFVILELIRSKTLSPDILHCNDHHTGLLPLLVRSLELPVKTVFTIHNFLYHGHFSVDESDMLPPGIREKLTPTQWNNFSALLESVAHADTVNTVSPGYAKELMAGINVDQHSLDVINSRPDQIQGILNGIDSDYWNPAKDTHLRSHYSISNLAGKKRNKINLLRKMNLDLNTDAPVVGSVSRLVENKGFSLIFASLDKFLRQGIKYVFLGSGDSKIAEQLKIFTRKYPQQLAFYDGFNESLAHLIEAGSDMFIMPSRFEPCGLNQLYSLRYGTIPIVTKTGGLGDSVKPWAKGAGTGFLFHPYDPEEFENAMDSALHVYNDRKEWKSLMIRAMQEDYSWAASAQHYIKLYKSWK